MTAAKKETRILTCVVSGKTFEYSGSGRPPMFCPEVKAARLKSQRAAARQKAAQKKANAKIAA